ncbi:hypothetical protein GMLC_23580 [Geomonas limicola]|uniref:Uncharacterized protein n=1 Tax=Geomonas limicola TaxID=2740186 RepID=A0A6V8NC47_9BACT|nr:ankyrin repeat domain-containing protein [Geomonas limicola]GFO68779.1 hypothetical protein GMLC_23580 [Geomonas limicola]
MTNDRYELHAAIAADKFFIVGKLIENGAFVNCQNEQGDTPLHIAVQKKNSHYIRLLITNGADVELPNSEGKTPLDIARTLKPKLLKEMDEAKKFVRPGLGSLPIYQDSLRTLELIQPDVAQAHVQDSRLTILILSHISQTFNSEENAKGPSSLNYWTNAARRELFANVGIYQTECRVEGDTFIAPHVLKITNAGIEPPTLFFYSGKLLHSGYLEFTKLVTLANICNSLEINEYLSLEESIPLEPYLEYKGSDNSGVSLQELIKKHKKKVAATIRDTKINNFFISFFNALLFAVAVYLFRRCQH